MEPETHTTTAYAILRHMKLLWLEAGSPFPWFVRYVRHTLMGKFWPAHTECTFTVLFFLTDTEELRLRKSLNSVLEQTLNDWYITILPRTSSSTCLRIAKEYVQAFPERMRMVPASEESTLLANTYSAYVIPLSPEEYWEGTALERLNNRKESADILLAHSDTMSDGGEQLAVHATLESSTISFGAVSLALAKQLPPNFSASLVKDASALPKVRVVLVPSILCHRFA